MEIMIMRPADKLGPILASRGLAAQLREELESEVSNQGGAALDFEGVETMSPSFADELLAKLSPTTREHIEILNLSDDLQALAAFVTASRS
jgi:STAS-like domain of unknown function (DUF4325)